MSHLTKEIIFSNIDNLKGVGKQLSKYLKNKKIEKVKDIILNLPYSETDRSKLTKIKEKSRLLSSGSSECKNYIDDYDKLSTDMIDEKKRVKIIIQNIFK